jgi:AbrB family looped-hinge helix DNA binding protein
MTAVTVSPKFQVVIPKEIREQMDISAGQRVQMMIYKGHIVLVPIRPMKELRGSLKGVTEPFEREEDRM